VNASINPASSSGWVTEIASLHKAHLLNQAYALTKTPSQCKGCAEALGHALPPTCMRDVVAMNVLTTEVRCLCLERSLESRLTQRRHTAVSLLVIDTEGYDLKVLQSYPFGTVPTWRVQFETKHLSREDRVATHQLLSQHGYLPLAQNHDDETWHHPKSNETFATGTEGASLQQAHASGTASPWRQLEQRQREHVESRRRAPI